MLHLVFAPGFFTSAPVHLALLTGGLAALVSGAVGAFTVLRGQSYAGHALADISVTGGSASYLLGISPLLGFAGTGVLAAGAMDMIGVRRPRGRALATALLVGPAAAALRITRRPGRATVLAAALGVVVTWLGIVLAYDSFTWPPRHDGWPVSFFVVALTVAGYLLAQLAGRRPARRH